MNEHEQSSRTDGFTLIEILIVVVVIGILSTVAVFAVRGVTHSGEMNSCEADRQTVEKAARFYMLENSVDAIPSMGALDSDQFERSLVDAEFLSGVSRYHDLAADGTVTTAGAPCP